MDGQSSFYLCRFFISKVVTAMSDVIPSRTLFRTSAELQSQILIHNINDSIKLSEALVPFMKGGIAAVAGNKLSFKSWKLNMFLYIYEVPECCNCSSKQNFIDLIIFKSCVLFSCHP